LLAASRRSWFQPCSLISLKHGKLVYVHQFHSGKQSIPGDRSVRRREPPILPCGGAIKGPFVQNPTEQALPPGPVSALLNRSACQKHFDLVAEGGIWLTAALLPKFQRRLSHSQLLGDFLLSQRSATRAQRSRSGSVEGNIGRGFQTGDFRFFGVFSGLRHFIVRWQIPNSATTLGMWSRNFHQR
jgi:hypothetical protein